MTLLHYFIFLGCLLAFNVAVLYTYFLRCEMKEFEQIHNRSFTPALPKAYPILIFSFLAGAAALFYFTPDKTWFFESKFLYFSGLAVVFAVLGFIPADKKTGKIIKALPELAGIAGFVFIMPDNGDLFSKIDLPEPALRAGAALIWFGLFKFLLVLNQFEGLIAAQAFHIGFSSLLLLVLTSFSFLYLNRSAVFEFLMDTFYQSEDYSSYVKKLEKKLQNFDLTKENKKAINHILKENALNHAYVELYDQDGIYFTDKSPLSSNNLLLLYSFDDLDVLEAPLYYDYPIHFKNQAVYLYITSFPMIPFQIPYIILSLLISFSFYLIILQSFIRKRIQSIQNLQEDVFTLAIGDWNHEIKVSDKDEIGRLAQDLNQMRIAFLQTMDNEQQARVVNKELISSLSHDLRTPLTTLKGYLEIMNLKKDDIKFRDQYLQKCLDKVEEITYLSNKMFEYSLVFSTEYNSDLSNIPVQKCIDTLVDHIQYLREMDLHILYEPLQTSLSMDANFAIIQRILNNVFSNIQKYCDPWKDIVIQTMIEEDQLKMSFTNSINHHLDKVESNGIGLKSVKKMIKIHHGTFYQDETNDLFTIILTFPIHQ